MKKLSLILLTVLSFSFLSCSKDSPVLTTYQIFNNSTKSTTTIPYLDGSMYEVVVYCYTGVDIVRQDNYDAIEPGQKTAMKEVPSTYTKIKVSYKMLPPASAYYDSSTNYRLYTVSYTLLEVEKNTVSEFNDNSMVSTSKIPTILNSLVKRNITFIK